MGIARVCRHLLANRARVNQAFPKASLDAIERAIKASEASHAGQIRFVVEGALDGRPLFHDQPARERALDLFAHLRVWDTAHNSGVLIHVLLADRNVEIVADRAIDAAVGHAEWQRICEAMESEFGNGRYEHGVIAGIEAVTRHLATHFPKGDGRNELPDTPVVL